MSRIQDENSEEAIDTDKMINVCVFIIRGRGWGMKKIEETRGLL